MELRRFAWISVTLVACSSHVACSALDRRPRRGSFIDDVEPRRAAVAVPMWRHAADVESLVLVREHQKSSHFLGAPDVEIRVNGAAAAYGRRGVELGEGALVVATHDLPEGTVRFAMEKRVGADARAPHALAWEYAVIDATSRAVEVGRIPTCVRCHEEAPSNEVFGPPGL